MSKGTKIIYLIHLGRHIVYLHQFHEGNKVDGGHSLAASLLLLLLLLTLG